MNLTVTATEDPFDDLYGHFDRRETLLKILTTPPNPAPRMNLADYTAMNTADRQLFDHQRQEHIIDGVVVETPPLAELRRLLHRALLTARKPVGRGGLILTGPATMGKTTASLKAMKDALRHHEARFPNWQELGHTPVVYIEVPPGSTGKAIMGRILEFFGLPVRSKMTLEERTQLVVHHLNHGRTSLLVIDEMQNLAKLTLGHFESAQAIKDLTNGIRAVPLLVGINLDQSVITNGILGEQFAARSKTVKLGRLGYATDDDRRLWKGAIHAFEQELVLLNHKPGTLFPHAELIWNLTRGSIGALANLLTTAALDLIDAGNPEDETITPDVLANVKLDLTTEREHDRIAEAEAKAGRKKSEKHRAA
ncbi:ATP-binding protein [Agromyces sp. NPDC058104]|uniref:ATP-binding protein n=1 Tax=Agromyces sp. NPDC058104 TaxID=3346342 RepID=UPI0036DE2363